MKSSDTNAAADVDEKESSDSGDTTVTVSSKEEQNTEPETEPEPENPAESEKPADGEEDGDKEALPIISDEKGTSSAAKGTAATGNTTPVSRGDVKSGTAFEINNYEKLVEFANRVNGGETDLNAELTADIVADENKVWIPIGCDADHKYVGVFDGGDHKITYLSNGNVISKPTCAGLFGYIGAEGVVKNITIENAEITGRVYAGALAGYNEGNLTGIQIKNTGNQNVEVKSDNSNEEKYIGGIAGYNKGTITVSCVSGKCTIHSVSNSSSNNTYNTYVGGIAGYNGGSIGNCYGDLSDKIMAEANNNAYVGGIAGYNDTGAAVMNCENRGGASLLAEAQTNNISVYVGGITGYNLGTISNSVDRGVGTIEAKPLVSFRICYCYVGAIAGANGEGGSVAACRSIGSSQITASGGRTGSEACAGGIAGRNQGTISTCFNGGTGVVTATASNNSYCSCAGGMVGYNLGTIEKSYRSGTGDISATVSSSSDSSYAGALVGYNDGSSAGIWNCYNCGNGEIKAATAAGGLAGYNSGTVQYAYYCGSDGISAAAIGGVIGKNEGTVTNCCYDRNVCAIEGATEYNNWKAVGDGDGGGTSVTGLTTDSMTGENATDPANMNFETGDETPWYPGLEYESGGLSCDCYPHLRGFVYDTTKDIADWPPHGVYKIGSYEKLKQFAETVNAGNANINAVLTADITCNDDEWIPIGDAQIKYVGTFDGCGHTVTGLSCTIDKSDPAESQSVYAGLFGYIGQGGTVKNIGIVNPKINANAISSDDEKAPDTDVFAGAIAGFNDGTIQQCYLSGSGTVRGTGISPCVQNMNVNAGALAGKNGGTIQDCCNYGSTAVKAGFKLTDDYDKTYNVNSKNEVNAGGIAGYNSGSIINCSNSSTGKITAAQNMRAVYIKESEKKVYNREVLRSYAGAIAGSVSDGGTVENCSYDFWSDDTAASRALTISSNKDVSYSDDAGVSITDGKAKIGGIKAGTVLLLIYFKDTANDDIFIGWYSNGILVTDSKVYEIIISDDVEFEIRWRDENERIIKYEANLNGEKQIWKIVTYTTNDDISFPKMNFYGFNLDGWKINDDVNNVSGALYTTEEAKNEVANKLGETATTITVEGMFSRAKEAANPGIPGLDGKYTVTVCCNDVVVERLFRDFPASEYFTFNADEIENYVNTSEKTFSHWLLDDAKISTNREVTFRVAKDCILNAVYVSDQSSSVKLTKVNIDNADNMELEAEVNCESSDDIDVTFRYQTAVDAITGKKDDRSYTYTAAISDIDANKIYAIQPYVIFNDGSEPEGCKEETVTVSEGTKVSENTFSYGDGSLTVSVDNNIMTLKANTTDSSVAFKYKKGDGGWTGIGKYQRDVALYEAYINDITDGIYYIQLVVMVETDNEPEPKIWKEEAVIVDGGMIVIPTSCFQYDEASLITKMTVNTDEGKMFITTAINSERVAKVLKVRFRYRDSMETALEIAGTKDDVTGKYTAAISGIDVNKVYSIQPVATINGVPVEGTRLEVLPKHGYDGNEKAYADIVDMKMNDGSAIFTEYIFVPTGCTISRAGVLISLATDKISDASVLDTVTDENEKIYNATIPALSGKIVDERGLTCTYTWTKKNIDQGNKVYVLPYLVYIDEFNNQHIVCGMVKNMTP